MTALNTQLAQINDYFAYIGEAVPADLSDTDTLKMNANLKRASSLIIRRIRLARYTIGPDGWPDEQIYKTALIDATCAQFDWFEQTDDITGALDKYDSVTMAGINFSRRATAQSTSTAATSRIAPEAIDILMTAGLFSTRVSSPWFS